MEKYTQESISEVLSQRPINHTALTIDLMDAYVAWFEPEDIDTWVKTCVSFPKVKQKINGVETYVKKVKAVRKYFLETYFPTETKEAREADKKAKKEAKEAAKEAAKAQKKNMSDEDKLRAKIEELKKKYK